MTADELRAARMRSQRLDGRARGVHALVSHVVGIQAQDPRAAALSIRARTEGLHARDVERAIAEDRSVVRIWAMRGTLHLVASEDWRWLHDLLAQPLLAGEARALGAIGVSEHQQTKAVSVIRRALAGGPLTRADLAERLDRAGIDASGRRAAHLPRLAALEGHVCFGPPRAGKDTFVLTADWVGDQPRLDREDALRELARRYVGAFGPAEPHDLAAWAGIPLRDARSAWPRDVGAPEGDPPDPPLVRLVPMFDTYLLGYRGRDVAVPAEHARRVWPGGGIVRATVLQNGLAVGTWRGAGDAELFEPVADEGLAAEVAAVRHFLAE